MTIQNMKKELDIYKNNLNKIYLKMQKNRKKCYLI